MLFLSLFSCKKELDVQNPNSPTLAQAYSESGLISLATGSVYINGFNGSPAYTSGQNWLGDSFFSLCYGYDELMSDDIGAEASNQNINVVGLPDYVILDDGTKTTNTSPQKTVLRISNSRDKKSANAFYYEWAYMYGLNNACNQVLALVDNITFSGDAATKKNTIKAWAYWWKGYAYSRIGSIYYAGLVNNTVNAVVPNYVTSAAIITESNRCLDLATGFLGSVTSATDYTSVLGQLLPAFVQTGKGGILTTQMWVRNINSLKARNLMANKLASTMTTTDWQAVLTLANTGIQSGDNVFTGRTNTTNGFFSASSGSVAAMATNVPKSATFKISERLVQEYKTGDKRLANNFTATTAYLNQVGGFTYSTRWQLADGGNGVSGAQTLSSKTAGNYELFIGPSYEENELMKAEALINTDNIEAGLASVDNVRTYQGAGLTKVAGTGLGLAAAKEELRRERRVALVFRGTAFYDARRWGVIYDISKGGGRTNAVVLSTAGILNTKATINYNFLDYWDVPADEAQLNVPATGSAPIVNPN
ncbi:MAG: RagB/SusD family nutrient uptake outer membrane protein [Sphingobacteriaceae bacterium]|nr:MAG: RagB/SusD family nutrient uptake outer membrane protein [Sphingobacteriaceae bacterium]